MPFFEAVRLALFQIRVQKLKSFFTLLGVTVGVMFLIAVVSIVEGMGKYMKEDFAGKLLGVNTFTLRSRAEFSEEQQDDRAIRASLRRQPLRLSDVDPIVAVLPAGSKWAVQSRDFNARPASSPYAREKQVMAMGVEGDYFAIKRYDLTSGRAFLPLEAKLGAPVVVIGSEVAKHFFPNLDAVGRHLKIANSEFEVIGVIEPQGSLFGMSMDRMAIAPFRSPMGRIVSPRGYINGLVVQGATPVAVTDAMEVVREVMRSRRKLRPAERDNFVMETSASALAEINKILNIVKVAGTALPAIGLIVGGMVIMNIMLVAVAERTHEIGIRKSLGARRKDILRQFLVESATLSTMGAIVGIVLGIIGAQIIAWKTPLPTTVAPWSIVVATLLGTVVGIVAGVYPASRASRLDPIDALRQE
jgi:putative ABC transport system permease protein